MENQAYQEICQYIGQLYLESRKAVVVTEQKYQNTINELKEKVSNLENQLLNIQDMKK
jgi:hypothetical protein